MSEAMRMYWTVGLGIVALVFVQVHAAELNKDVEAVYFRDAIAKFEAVTSERIVSGWDAVDGQHPHQASLRLVSADGGVGACGGSVVHRTWVISAAHCTTRIIGIVVRAGVVHITAPQYIGQTHEWWNHPNFDETRPTTAQPNDISIIKLPQPVVYSGVVHITAPQYIGQTHEWWNHPGFDETRPTTAQPNDISIIKLPQPVVYSDMLKAIRVQPSADSFKSYADEIVVASGWGQIWTNGIVPDTLKWVYLTAIANDRCAWTFGASLITDSTVCARYYNVTSQSICLGDSGGPLVHTGSDGIPTLIGIASIVAGGQFGCHSGLPAGFTRPGPYIPWLNEITGLDFNNINEDNEPTTTTIVPTTTSTLSPTTTSTLAPTTTQVPSTTTPKVEPEESDESSESEEDPKLSELLNKLTVKVKVKVKVNNKLKRKMKLKCVDKF